MKALLFALSLCITAPISAQHMGTYRSHELDSKAFGKKREIKVFSTQAIDELPEQPVPVLYVLDGQYEPFWGMVTQMVNYLGSTEKFPQALVVGITTEHRQREFTPAPEDERTRQLWDDTPIGDAALLSSHMRDEVIPFIEANYSVAPLRMAIGHSLGGTFVSNSILEQQGLFKAVISVSPNATYDYGWMPRKLSAMLQGEIGQGAWHYMAAGSIGDMENSFRKWAEKADSVYHSKPNEQLVWHYQFYEGKDHMTSPIVSILDGLVAFNNFWNISDEALLTFLNDTNATYVQHIQNHYHRLSSWAGFDIALSADEINGLGYLAAFEDDWHAALGVIEWGIAVHPDDPNLYDSKGECLENLGQISEALTYYSKALEVLDTVKDKYDAEELSYYAETFQVNANRVKDALGKNQ